MKNRIFVSLLCIAILYTTVCSTVCASDFSEAGLIEEGASVLVQDAEGNELLINKEVYDEAVTISEDVAKEAALLFVSDIIACEDGVEWNENTAVTSIVPMYDEDTSTSITEEQDSGGGSRTVNESTSKKDIIYEENNGVKTPITQSIINPKIEGAIVTAKGANDANVKTNIIEAVEAVTGLATYKIQVFEMN